MAMAADGADLEHYSRSSCSDYAVDPVVRNAEEGVQGREEGRQAEEAGYIHHRDDAVHDPDIANHRSFRILVFPEEPSRTLKIL